MILLPVGILKRFRCAAVVRRFSYPHNCAWDNRQSLEATNSTLVAALEAYPRALGGSHVAPFRSHYGQRRRQEMR